MPVIPVLALGRMRQEDFEFETSLSYIVKQNKTKQNKPSSVTPGLLQETYVSYCKVVIWPVGGQRMVPPRQSSPHLLRSESPVTDPRLSCRH
jgi:hypothetical protein